MSQKNVSLVAPRSFTSNTMAPNSLYLDGAVAGTILNPALNSWSFDHHGEGSRFDRTCAAKQMFSALVQGLDLSDITDIFTSSIDADSVVATWLATNSVERSAELKSNLRFQLFIDKLDRVDSHGPAALLMGESALKASFELSTPRIKGEDGRMVPVPETTEVLLAQVSKFEEKFIAGTYDECGSMPPREGIAIGLTTKGEISLRVEGAVSFSTIYATSNFGVVYANGSYTVGKLPFAAVKSFKEGLFAALNAKEANGQWGGADSIGGSPMGKTSSLSEAEVLEIVKAWALS